MKYKVLQNKSFLSNLKLNKTYSDIDLEHLKKDQFNNAIKKNWLIKVKQESKKKSNEQ